MTNSTKQAAMQPDDISRLIDQRRDLAAQVAGLDLRIALAIGDREAARRAQHEMYAQVEARRAARFAMCRAMGAH